MGRVGAAKGWGEDGGSAVWGGWLTHSYPHRLGLPSLLRKGGGAQNRELSNLSFHDEGQSAQEQNVQEGRGGHQRKEEGPPSPESSGPQVRHVGGSLSHTPTRPQPPSPCSHSGCASLRACGRRPSTGHIAATCCCIPSEGGGASSCLPTSGLPVLLDQAEATSSPGPLPRAKEAVEGGAQAAAAALLPPKLPFLSACCRSPARI